MSNLIGQINTFIRSVEFEPDGSVFLTTIEEFEITKPDSTVVKVPHQASRHRLEINDSATETLAGMFAPALRQYWALLLGGE